jgi:adenylate cyclase
VGIESAGISFPTPRRRAIPYTGDAKLRGDAQTMLRQGTSDRWDRVKASRLRLVQALGGFLILLLLLAPPMGWIELPVLQRLEWVTYDLRVRGTLPFDEDPSLILIDIDERSLFELGQWVWPRARIAELIERLFDDYQVALLGVDVVFAEPERNPLLSEWPALMERYPELAGAPPPLDGDAQLASALARYPVVLGFYFQSRQGPTDPPPVGLLPRTVELDPPPGDLDWLPLPRPERYTANLHPLQEAAFSGGFIDNPFVDDDGVVRRVALLQIWEDAVYPSLSLGMLMGLLGHPPIAFEVSEGGGMRQLEALDVGGFRIPVDARGAALVPWYGPRGQFEYISAADVLRGEADRERLAGATVLLGSTAPGLMDLRATPVSSVYPGAEINLSLLAGMLHQSFRAAPAFTRAAEVVTLGFVGLLMILVFPFLKAPLLILASGLLLAVLLAGNLWAWNAGWVLPLASGLLLVVSQTVWQLTFNFVRESQQKNWVAERFGQYVPPQLVDDMVESGQSFGLQGEARDLTVLFSDIESFTGFSEGLEPEVLSQVMNQLLTPLTEAIHKRRGTIDKYMGDAIMAFWGAPLRDPEHARHALEGAVAMREALAGVNRKLEAEGWAPLAMGIGINSGMMSVGNMGSSFRMAYTVMGDNVNIGSRLEKLTRFYRVPIIVSEFTVAKVPEWAFRRIDRVRVKGRETPFAIFAPLGPRDALSPETADWVARHDRALADYDAGNFAGASQQFRELDVQRPADPLVRLYLERLELLESQLPEHWDGVWSHKS